MFSWYTYCPFKRINKLLMTRKIQFGKCRRHEWIPPLPARSTEQFLFYCFNFLPSPPPGSSSTPLQGTPDKAAAAPWALCKAKSSQQQDPSHGSKPVCPVPPRRGHSYTWPHNRTWTRIGRTGKVRWQLILGQLAQPVSYFYDKANLQHELSHPDAAITGTQDDSQ